MYVYCSIPGSSQYLPVATSSLLFILLSDSDTDFSLWNCKIFELLIKKKNTDYKTLVIL